MPILFCYQLIFIFSLYCFATSLGIGLLVLQRWKSGSIRFWFAVVCFLACAWCLGDNAANLTSPYKAIYILYLRLASFGWLFAGPGLFILLAFFLGQERLVRTRRQRLWLMALALPFWIAIAVDPEYFFALSLSRSVMLYSYRPTAGFTLIMVSILGWTLATGWIIVSSYRRQSDPLIRRRGRLIGALLLFITTLVILTDVLLPAWNYYNPSAGGLVSTLFCLIFFDLTQRFQLLPSAQVLHVQVDQLQGFNQELERLVLERTKELEATYLKLAESARMSGKAEMAMGVLHDLGNVVNSMGVRMQLMLHPSTDPAVAMLDQALAFLDENRDLLGPFWSEHPKGKQLLPFLCQCAVAFHREGSQRQETLDFIADRIRHIAKILAAQQHFYRPGLWAEPTDLNQIMKETLALMEDSLLKRGLKVEKDWSELPVINLDRSLAMQVMHNLLKNAMEAVEKNTPDKRRIRVQTQVTAQDPARIEIMVEDNGAGIRPEDLPHLFEFGFTTKAESGGHGFGLQASANYIQSLGGRIEAESRGPGQGAAFRVCLPLGPDPDPITPQSSEEAIAQEAASNV
jgi:signal transduction histidine kinase